MKLFLSHVWIQEFWRLLGFLLVMLLFGLWLGQTILLVLVALLIYLGWHLFNLYRLENWFRHDKKGKRSKKNCSPPEVPGIWGEVFYQFYRLQQRNRKRKQKLGTILKRFQHSTAAMPDAAVVLGKHYEIEWLNRAARQLLGLQSPQDRGKPITHFIRSPRFAEYLASAQVGFKNHENASSVKLVSPVDSHLMLRVNVVPYANNQHLLLARDITQLHRLEQIRTDFIANVSHELRTPLTVINGFIETMQDAEDECSEQWKRPLLLMAQQTARMRSIIDDLLLLTRLESDGEKTDGAEKAAIELVNVPEILHALKDEAKIVSGDKAHQITLDADEDLLVYGHEEELRSAFTNIVLNAVRYTPAGGEIKLGWYEDNQGIHFEVSDTGEGIALEHIPRLTERFYRVDVARSRSQGGTGLGLAIVKHVLNRHKGHLHIESVVGKGSTFRCDFPPQQKVRQL
jgi:two-component system phosphate regulon sensor histidine kinase PhoR